MPNSKKVRLSHAHASWLYLITDNYADAKIYLERRRQLIGPALYNKNRLYEKPLPVIPETDNSSVEEQSNSDSESETSIEQTVTQSKAAAVNSLANGKTFESNHTELESETSTDETNAVHQLVNENTVENNNDEFESETIPDETNAVDQLVDENIDTNGLRFETPITEMVATDRHVTNSTSECETPNRETATLSSTFDINETINGSGNENDNHECIESEISIEYNTEASAVEKDPLAIEDVKPFVPLFDPMNSVTEIMELLDDKETYEFEGGTMTIYSSGIPKPFKSTGDELIKREDDSISSTIPFDQMVRIEF